MKVKMIKNTPWLVPDSIEFLALIFAEADLKGRQLKVIETGSGGSTLFFSMHAGSLLSFEHNRRWYNIVKTKLEKIEIEGIEKTKLSDLNIELRFDPDYPREGLRHIDKDYDIALIDGRGRVRSIASVVSHIKNGGWLILDNAERQRYRPAVKALNLAFKEKIVFEKDWTTTFWKIQNKKK